MAAHDAGDTWQNALMQAAAAAQRGAEDTKTMAAAAGRSSYVPGSVLRNVPDPGAQAVAIWLAAIARSLLWNQTRLDRGFPKGEASEDALVEGGSEL